MKTNFSFKLGVKPTASSGAKLPAVTAVNAFETADDEQVDDTSKPFDYVKARIESQQRQAALEAAEGKWVVGDDMEKESPSIKASAPTSLGPAAIAARNSGKSETSSSTKSLTRAGLVLTNENPSAGGNRKGESKHIQRMVETSQVNEKFKNLLRIKISEKEKVKAEEEFGQRPEEFITSAYNKKREESLALEKELEAKESMNAKRDMKNLFKEMLDSGSYARSNYVEPRKVGGNDAEAKVISPDAYLSAASTELAPEMVKKVLEKIVPESTREVASLVEEQARMDVLKIVQQLDIQESEDREEARMSAKERYLMRKKQRLL